MKHRLPDTAHPEHLKKQAKRLLKEGHSSDVLVYTNGQSAIRLMEEAGIPGRLMEWSDALMDGPAPLTDAPDAFTEVRARHLSSLGFAGYDNILSRFAAQETPLQSSEPVSELQLWTAILRPFVLNGFA